MCWSVVDIGFYLCVGLWLIFACFCVSVSGCCRFVPVCRPMVDMGLYLCVCQWLMQVCVCVYVCG